MFVQFWYPFFVLYIWPQPPSIHFKNLHSILTSWTLAKNEVSFPHVGSSNGLLPNWLFTKIDAFATPLILALIALPPTCQFSIINPSHTHTHTTITITMAIINFTTTKMLKRIPFSSSYSYHTHTPITNHRYITYLNIIHCYSSHHWLPPTKFMPSPSPLILIPHQILVISTCHPSSHQPPKPPL